MLSAFHKKKLRTTFFSEYHTDNRKMLPAFEKKKMWTTFHAKDDTDNMKMLFAFHKKKMLTTFLFEKLCRQVFTLIHLYFKE